MQTFKTSNISGWTPLSAGEVIAFDTPGNSRRVQLSIMANGLVSVFASENEDMSEGVLVGYGDGALDLEFSTRGGAFVSVEAEPGVSIFGRSRTADMIVEASPTPAFTGPLPTQRRDANLERMMRMMRENENARTEAMKHEIAKLQEQALAVREPKAETKTEAKEEVVENDLQEESDPKVDPAL